MEEALKGFQQTSEGETESLFLNTLPRERLKKRKKKKRGDEEEKKGNRKILNILKLIFSITWKLLLVLVIITGIVLSIIFRENIKIWLNYFLTKVKSFGIWGVLIYIAVYAIATVFFIPGSLLTIGAGFIYGLWMGLPIISIGSTLGATLAFIAGKTIARSIISNQVKKYPKFEAIDRAIEAEGWKIVLLLRLIPLIPFNLLNYALALTKVGIIAYILSSWIGMLPGTALFVYLGSSSRDLTDILVGNVGSGLALKIGLMVVSGILIIVAFIVILYIGRKAMTKYMKEIEDEKLKQKEEEGEEEEDDDDDNNDNDNHGGGGDDETAVINHIDHDGVGDERNNIQDIPKQNLVIDNNFSGSTTYGSLVNGS